MNSQVGGVPEVERGVGSGGWGSLIKVCGPGKEVMEKGAGEFVGGNMHILHLSLFSTQ